MRLIAALIAVFTFASSSLAAPQVLSIPAQGGPIRITPIFHASMQIEYRGLVIHVDPFSMGNYAKAKKAPLIFITHNHPDHLDKNAINKIKWHSVSVIVPRSLVPELSSPSKTQFQITGLANGDRYTFNTNDGPNQSTQFKIYVMPVAAYNLKRGPKPGQKFHPKGEFNGYVLTMGGKRIYIAGDTEATPEMKKLKNIDVAFLPMNLPYTMTPQEAANAARAFKPKMAVPYHYRYPFDKPNTNPQQFAQLLKNTGIQVKLLDWYAR